MPLRLYLSGNAPRCTTLQWPAYISEVIYAINSPKRAFHTLGKCKKEKGVIGEAVWSNKEWEQLLEFKGHYSFGYEYHQSVTTSDLLPEAPVGCRDVVFVVVSDSAGPPLPSICTISFYFVVLLCTHKLLSFLRTAPFTVCCSHSFMAGTEPSIHGPDMTVLC